MTARKRAKEKLPRRSWSGEERTRLAKLYPDRPTIKVAKLLNRTLAATYGMAEKLGVEKSQQELPDALRAKLAELYGVPMRTGAGGAQ